MALTMSRPCSSLILDAITCGSNSTISFLPWHLMQNTFALALVRSVFAGCGGRLVLPRFFPRSATCAHVFVAWVFWQHGSCWRRTLCQQLIQQFSPAFQFPFLPFSFFVFPSSFFPYQAL
jgi:hypothetical protein